jgi:hypothetical protein
MSQKYVLPRPTPQPRPDSPIRREAEPRGPDPRTVRPLGPEDMTEREIEGLMARSQPKGRPEWRQNEFGERRPLSAWDHV